MVSRVSAHLYVAVESGSRHRGLILVKTIDSKKTVAVLGHTYDEPRVLHKRRVSVDEAIQPSSEGKRGSERLVVSEVATLTGDWLTPEMNIKQIMGVFDRTGSDELAVLDDGQQLLGVLSEAYATRRYAEELETARRDLTGGD